MYDSSRDPPSSPGYNAWTVLANTEKWISETLAAAATPAGNPYTRKEVSYACEPSADTPMIVASIFRRLKEVRELGERHGEDEESRAEDVGKCIGRVQASRLLLCLVIALTELELLS